MRRTTEMSTATDTGDHLQQNKPQDNAIQVMLVDDSSVIRGALTQLLEEDASIHIIASIPNGELAVKAAGRYKPDVIILDIEMPVMDGITALPQILKESPRSKVIMFSTLTEQGAHITLKALALGAIECLVKPAAGEARKGGIFHQNLLQLVKSLAPKTPAAAYAPSAITVATAPATGATATPAPQPAAPTPTPAATAAAHAPSAAPPPQKPRHTFSLRPQTGLYAGRPHILAIGSSTGGPQALFDVLKHCAGFSIPIVITQHMPAKFTTILAQHIQQQTGIPACEGQTGMALEAGKAYIAPGGFHMVFQRSGLQTQIRLDDGEPVNYCKPAVDPMLESLLPIYGNKMLGVILTGMGHDGLGGGKALSALGGQLIAQDEATSVVWGMPGAVAMAGVCSAVLPLREIGPAVKKIVTGM